MKRKFYAALPEMFALRPSNYAVFLQPTSARDLMVTTWAGLGQRMAGAIHKVGAELGLENDVEFVSTHQIRTHRKNAVPKNRSCTELKR